MGVLFHFTCIYVLGEGEKGREKFCKKKKGDKERERKAESEGRKLGKFRGIRFQRKKQKSDTRMSLRSMEPQGEVRIVTVRAKGIRALKEVKSRKVKTGYQLGHGQPWGWATNAKEPTRAPYDKHEGNREAFGYPSALRVVTISLRCTIHVHMRNDMRSGPRILGRQLKKTKSFREEV